ncbi:cell division protein FtsQ/DivIB [Sulfuriflexus mobilis]|uniref:cell division protein FtsQ/DivIB n=1 Tax=Sulfuriflexus mobilis TaxID=1811807 RepID=UPI000F836074|nr:cell division protein FtsQ/DivIB [Sulfuriflexus mobilis]
MMRKRKINRLNTDRVETRRIILRLLAGTFGVLAVAAVAIWGGATLRDPATLPLRSVHLKGEFIQVSEQALREVVVSSGLAGFFSSDLETLTRRLREMPWVESVAVRRVWPDVLHITVIEQQAVAYWNDKALLNETGQVFRPDKASFPQGLPQFNGPVGTEMQILEAYGDMRAILRTAGRDIDVLGLDARRAWQLQLDNGIQLALGRQDSRQRLQRFTRAYAYLFNEQQEIISTVDLRYTNGFAVRWQQLEDKNAAEAGVGMKNHVQKS